MVAASATEIRHGETSSGDVRIHYAEAGPESGPVVLLVHGFPELAFSWRHQLPALAGAGYRAVALDVRGYGRSGKPAAIEAYRMVLHVADNVALAGHLGAERVVVVGHDWGSPIASSSALLRPDLFDAVALLSVPYNPPPRRRPTEAFAEMVGPEHDFYINYFQEAGKVEDESEQDLRRWLAAFYYGAAYEGASSGAGASLGVIPKGARMVDRLPEAPGELDWLPARDFEVYVAEFERTGLRGGLNRYRNIDRDAEDLAAWRDRPLEVPALFIGGDHDGPTRWGARAIADFPRTLPQLCGNHLLERCGHWVQQEQPEEVNRLLLDFLAEVRPL
jgi:pimeloyl-ACP methyl ester carboxylesterase